MMAAAAGDTGAKRKARVIGTHSGTFHCDEALGCYMVRRQAEVCVRPACACRIRLLRAMRRPPAAR